MSPRKVEILVGDTVVCLTIEPNDTGLIIATCGKCKCKMILRRDFLDYTAKVAKSINCDTFPRCMFPVQSILRNVQLIYDEDCVVPVTLIEDSDDDEDDQFARFCC